MAGMSYVEGRFSDPRSKRWALTVLALLTLGSFLHGMFRDVEFRPPWASRLVAAPQPAAPLPPTPQPAPDTATQAPDPKAEAPVADAGDAGAGARPEGPVCGTGRAAAGGARSAGDRCRARDAGPGP
ncbi:hypothetical protein LRS10_14010 [Phenylobacterium sp. J426]|uniref:hypothetical protein n=1 Tax=Phenylobacterium sp. J426 TaxID=2898439 RepID=UPI002150F6C5|nr:hypothetical protein [Phenylobacterium sp. J426]MCR5875205.1 hypothetical protein [Phenylobacterium sp. J426]